MEKIDLTPTWGSALNICLNVLENGTEEGKKLVISELRRMADLADKYNKLQAETEKIYVVLDKRTADYNPETSVAYSGTDESKALELYNRAFEDSKIYKPSCVLQLWIEGKVVDERERTYRGGEFHWIKDGKKNHEYVLAKNKRI